MDALPFKPRKNLYAASNIVLDPRLEQATSYNWWVFVKRINGLLVFNDHPYSPTTCRHQAKVRETLWQLGLKIDVTLATALSLTDAGALSDPLLVAQAEEQRFLGLQKSARKTETRAAYAKLALEQLERAVEIEKLIKRSQQ